MKKNNFLCINVILLLCGWSVEIVSKFDIKAMFDGMGTTFGAPPVGYTYNFEVWSDASVPIYVEQEGIASFMGAFFPSAKGFYGKRKLPSIFDANGAGSQLTYNNQNYYFKLYISDNETPHKHPIYHESFTQLPLTKRDPKIFYYHVYTSSHVEKGELIHVPAVENMGYQDPSQLHNSDATKKGNVTFSSQLSQLVFYNSSGSIVQVSLTYGNDPYTFTLEPYSFNQLGLPTPMESDQSSTNGTDGSTVAVTKSSTTKNADPQAPLFSLRPNTLSFTVYNQATKEYTALTKLALPAKGFDGTSYTIEIFQDQGKPLQVGIQGFQPGHYSMPTTERVRDITPCPCTFWYQSSQQAGSVEGYSDLPGQIWVLYTGGDSPIMAKVTPGQVVTWNLVRPLLEQGNQLVYFLYVVTTDDAVAEQFVKKIAAETIGKNVINQYQKIITTPLPRQITQQVALDTKDTKNVSQLSLTANDQIATLMGNLSTETGAIQDVDQKVIGYIVGVDTFMPQGIGFGRFYYELRPSVMNFSVLASSIASYLDSTKTSSLTQANADLGTSLLPVVQSWFTMYLKNPQSVVPKIEQFLLEYANGKIVDSTTGQLTKFGKSRAESIVSGSISLQYPSLQLSTVTNHYVYDFGKSAPDKMPTVTKKIDRMVQKKSAATTKSGSAAKAVPQPVTSAKAGPIKK